MFCKSATKNRRWVSFLISLLHMSLLAGFHHRNLQNLYLAELGWDRVVHMLVHRWISDPEEVVFIYLFIAGLYVCLMIAVWVNTGCLTVCKRMKY